VTVDESDWLAQRFEEHRSRLRGVAYRMLGSLSEADDAVQEAWIRLSRSDTSDVENLGGWLTTVVARVSLDTLRSRKSRREESLATHVPDPIVTRDGGAADPAHQALLAESIGLALLVVLERLAPDERLAFVLHDMFAVPFEEIAPIVGRTATAARQLASRARRRVQSAPPAPERDLARQREVVDAFLAAAHGGHFDALVAVLAPDVVLRADVGSGTAGVSREIRGAEIVAKSAVSFSQRAVADASYRPALVNGAAGVVAFVGGKPVSVSAFTVVGGKIVEINLLADPARLARIDFSALDPSDATGSR
jgi:RNA polymerase sigma factor (sigma-70 family)